MRNFNLAALVAIAAFSASTPALAADDADGFVGPRAEVMVGYENIRATSLPTDEDGIAWAGAIGYDARIAQDVVLGVDLEMGDSDNSRNVIPGLDWDTGRTLYAGGKLGFAMSPSSMIYGKVGYANSEARLVSGGNTWTVREIDGVRLGAGLEQKVTDTVYLKGEYRYTDQTNTVSSHQLMTGVGLRF